MRRRHFLAAIEAREKIGLDFLDMLQLCGRQLKNNFVINLFRQIQIFLRRPEYIRRRKLFELINILVPDNLLILKSTHDAILRPETLLELVADDVRVQKIKLRPFVRQIFRNWRAGHNYSLFCGLRKIDYCPMPLRRTGLDAVAFINTNYQVFSMLLGKSLQ